MSFKVGMLLEACIRGQFVFDKSRNTFAKPIFDPHRAEFALHYLDGGFALLYRNTFNQLEPVEQDLVPTKKEFEEREAWYSGKTVVPLEKVMFEGDLIPDSCKEEGRSGGLSIVNGALACLACEV